MSANLLAAETSPYLLQHKDNPVHWRAWGEAAFAEARAGNRPILLSVGYAACHWCHVMAHESFENAEVAALMNELFVCVKVDREERPDVDQIYQHALALLGQQGGWPLTMFCTPDGEPFWGGTYFPYPAKYGRPGFDDVLRGLATAWREKPDDIETNRAALKAALEKLGQPKAAEGGVSLQTVDEIAARLVQEVDPTWGGVGRAPKFPSPYAFEMLWRAWLRGGRREARLFDAVTVTLDRMCQGGIYDHLGGGFARYATDAQWLIPHFEKMLYDNAQLIRLLTLVWQETKSPLYAARIEETCDWLLREMVAGDGADRGLFAASYDADSEHEEGKFYVWDEDEIDFVLGPDASLFKQAYDVSALGNWERRNILHRNHAPALLNAEAEAKLAASRAKLKAVRDRRVWPGWDDKALADWNGLTIAALALAGATFKRADWLEAARVAFEQAMRLLREPDGRLRHSWRHGVAKHVATLDDYAHLIDGALMLHEAGAGESYLERALDLAAIVQAHYGDGAGGYFYSADDAGDLIVRAKHCNDNAVPSGNGAMLHNLVRMWLLTGEPQHRERADALVRAFTGELERNFFPLMTLLNGVELLESAIEIVVVGDPDDPATQALLDAVYGRCLPNRVLRRLTPGAALPAGHPAAGKGLVGGKPAAYVCRNMSCSAPATTPQALADALQ